MQIRDKYLCAEGTRTFGIKKSRTSRYLIPVYTDRKNSIGGWSYTILLTRLVLSLFFRSDTSLLSTYVGVPTLYIDCSNKFLCVFAGHLYFKFKPSVHANAAQQRLFPPVICMLFLLLSKSPLFLCFACTQY